MELLSLNRVDRFYPTALAKFLGISPGEAFNYLVERSGKGDQLSLMWEVRCPECYRTLDILSTKVYEEYDCNCGVEIEANDENLFPVFKINEDFKDFLRSESQKKNQNTQLEDTKRHSNPAKLKGKPMNLRNLSRDTEFSHEALEILQSYGIQNMVVLGDFLVGSHKIDGSFNNSPLNGNVAIQSQETNQVQQGTQVEYTEPLKDLELRISQITDEIKREQAESNAELLKLALEENAAPKIEKFIKFLTSSLGLVKPLLTIAELAGVPVPNNTSV